MKKSILFFVLFFSGFVLVKAQDIHFSYFQLQPIVLNPALTGHFEGTVRVGGIYRDQGRAVTSSGRYATPSFYLDSPVIRGFGKYDWVGVGASFTLDGAGSSRLKTTISALTLSYHLSFDKNRQNIISFGAQMAGFSRKFSADNFNWGDELDVNGNFNESTAENNLEFAFGEPMGMPIGYTSWSGGIVFTSKPNRDTDFQGGITLAHINKPRQSVATTGRDSLSMRLTGFASFTTRTGKRTKLTPTVLYQKLGQSSEIVAQLIGQYRLNDEKDITLNGGIGYRLAGHPILYFGMKKGNLNVGLSYDIDMSTLRQANGTVGAFELGANYIISLYKKPNPNPVIFCPRF